MKKIIVFIFVIFAAANIYAQNKTADSLKLLFSKEKTDTGRVRLMISIGSRFGYGYLKNDSVLWYSQQALDISKKINYSRGEIGARENIARYLYTNGNFKPALEMLLQNLKEEKEQKDTGWIFSTMKDLMKSYRNMGDFNKELEYAKNFKTLLYSGYFKDSIDLKLTSTFYLNHMASGYGGLGKLDSALYYYLESYRNFQESKNNEGIAVGTDNLADVYANIGKEDSAFSLYKRSIPYAINSKRFDIVAEAKLGLSKLYLKRDQSDSALLYARQALIQLENTQSPDESIEAYSLLSKLYQNKHQYDSAFKYLQSYDVMKDSVSNQNKIVQAQNFSFNETLRQQQLEQAKKEAQQQYATKIKVYILAAIIAVFLTIAFLLLRNNRNKQKANKLLHQKNEEIESTLSELKSTQSQLIQSEKMASLGELTAGIAHEIQNPLNFVNNFSEVNTELLGEMKSELLADNKEGAISIANDVIENQEKILHHGKRADAIVKGMLQHSRVSSGVKEPTDINALCDEYFRLSYHGLRAKDKDFNATMKTDFDESIGKINIVAQDIGRVILNLINNAFYAVNQQKSKNLISYEPTVSVTTKRSENSVSITVSDNGNGIPQKIVDKIFQPFFTTKPTGQGTGLGLSLSYDIVKAAGGEIKVETKEGEGTEFTIQLPFKENS